MTYGEGSTEHWVGQIKKCYYSIPDSGFDPLAMSDTAMLGSKNRLTRSLVALTARGSRAVRIGDIRPNSDTQHSSKCLVPPKSCAQKMQKLC